jgi:AraC-like DNA-binding protein
MKELLNEAISVTYHHGAYSLLDPSWHDKNVIVPNSKIYYVTDGEIAVEVGEKILIAAKGDAILIPAGVKHAYHLTEKGYAKKYWFHFDLRSGGTNFFDKINFPYITHLGIEKETLDLFENAVKSEKDSLSLKRINSSAAVLSIISKYLHFSGFSEIKSEPEDETDAVISYIKKNYADKFTLYSLSKMARLTPNYFAKKFRERTGYPPLKYINILRIERAKFLLEHSDMKISEIMEKTGFLDAAHFSKLFKLATGYSPKGFRASFGKNKV